MSANGHGKEWNGSMATAELEREIYLACLDTACECCKNWDEAKFIRPNEIWTSEDRILLARAYFESIALYIREDPALALRVVKYLHNYAIPPLRNDVGWFSSGAMVLFGLARPWLRVQAGSEPIFDDIRRGIEEAEMP